MMLYPFYAYRICWHELKSFELSFLKCTTQHTARNKEIMDKCQMPLLTKRLPWSLLTGTLVGRTKRAFPIFLHPSSLTLPMASKKLSTSLHPWSPCSCQLPWFEPGQPALSTDCSFPRMGQFFIPVIFWVRSDTLTVVNPKPISAM